MIRWLWKKDPDHQEFISELARSHPGRNYNPMDRYSDFRRLFLETEQGRRVLHEILTSPSFCGMYKTPAVKANFDPYQMMFFNGQQDIGNRLLAAINVEPKHQPKSTKEKQ